MDLSEFAFEISHVSFCIIAAGGGVFAALIASRADQISRLAVHAFTISNAAISCAALAFSLLFLCPLPSIRWPLVAVGIFTSYLLERVPLLLLSRRKSFPDSPSSQDLENDIYGGDETQPFLSRRYGNYSSNAPIVQITERSVLDAMSTAAEGFVARCVMCHDTITTTRGIAYHSAGSLYYLLQIFTDSSLSISISARLFSSLCRCPAQPIASHSLTHRSMAALTGHRTVQQLPIRLLPSFLLLNYSYYAIVLILGLIAFHCSDVNLCSQQQILTVSPSSPPPTATHPQALLTVPTVLGSGVCLAMLWMLSQSLGFALRQSRKSFTGILTIALAWTIIPLISLAIAWIALRFSPGSHFLHNAQSLCAGVIMAITLGDHLPDTFQSRDAWKSKLAASSAALIAMCFMAKYR